ncbi:pyruvate kinase [Ponticaulis sp.]|uniref:pyruvate kinase n=1 Tax=Ponticaulis sp. TaxID=2020902 RepID=UPI000B6EA171|nr:pyruvate kinase [Ponticaulis sp.]MAJ09096.1 pyruvate kinase [Ponticaulis sp.]RPG16885.1 MAG: pyruvate kinase [Hyphomonadaceae bacterium TMED125]HBH89757.1 pyruvate kinase [Hyphomonadaceae bacterium]HBJ91871.1 pyruvate kinase [Hyphomonadaceae bacterium]
MHQRLCKIVSTIGPATSSPDMLRMIHEAGVNVFRLNMSHGQHDKLRNVVKSIREMQVETGVATAIFADLQGPKIRTGTFEDGSIQLRYGQEYRLVNAASTTGEGVIPVPHQEVFDALDEGAVIKLDDGKLQMTVTGRDSDALIARADAMGTLSDRKGINIPDRSLPISALTEKDREDLEFALSMKVDYIALSFVQRPSDVHEARELIGDKAGIISKIEKPSAIEHLDEIIEASDAIMVARGDLGVECPVEDVPIMQRRIIRACRRVGKPVIVATHMLESMVESKAPTRAEASDISSAVNQGADAVMLSAETAVGSHPQTAVAIMDRVISATERDPETACYAIFHSEEDHSTTADAVSLSARRITEVLECRFAVAYTNTGSTARRLARDRPYAPILAATPNVEVAQSLSLCWGVTAKVTEDISDFGEMIARADTLASEAGGENGERIVILSGFPFGRSGKTNTLKISRIGAIEDDG